MSDVGRCRKVNQDMFLLDDALGLYAIADGMGGHAAGEVASDLAITALAHSLRGREEERSSWTPAEAGDLLRQALNDGNRKICESVLSRAEWRGMGTTMVALVLADERAIIAHVGDSRAYLLRNGELRQLTSDHSWVNEQVKLGLLTREQAQRHPMRNIVTRALGNQPEVEVDLSEESIRPGDIFTLCSDGLSGMLDDAEIHEILQEHGAVPQAACRELVDRANARGGEDNITVIVMLNEA
jgi:serine/threonine protein phosphatase PrpC